MNQIQYPSQPLFAEVRDRWPALSNGEARRLIRAGRVSVNGSIVFDEGVPVTSADLIALGGPENQPLASEARHSTGG
jgi:ribosomal protein S4